MHFEYSIEIECFDHVEEVEGQGHVCEAMSEADLPERVKLVLLGDTQVGKTCLLARYREPHGPFRENQAPSIGGAVVSKPFDFGGLRVNASFWDTAGQERFRSMAPNYYRKAKGAVLVYDITNRESFDHLQSWIDELRERGEPNVLMVIAGNKADLKAERVVSEVEGQNFAAVNKCLYMETSALLNLNVQELFSGMARGVVRRIRDGSHAPLDLSILSLVDDVDTREGDKCCPMCS